MEGGLTKRVRAFLADNPEGRLTDLYAAFAGENFRALNKTLGWMEKRGELVLPDPSYRYTRVSQSVREKKQTAIWRAIRNLAKKTRVIDPVEVEVLSGASRDYLIKYVLWLEEQGFVDRRPTGLAVLEKAMKHPETPLWNRREAEKAA